ncbi:MAG: cache domain-containing protein [bacterium]
MSLFKKIIINFLLVGVVPIAFFGFFIVNKVFEITKEAAFKESLSTTRQIGWQIDTYFETLLKSMESLASLPELVDFDKQKVDLFLSSYYTNYTIYYDGLHTVFKASPFESFNVLDDRGTVRTSYPLPEDNIGLDYSEHYSFQEVKRKKESYILPDVLISEVTKEPIIRIAIPVFQEDGEVSSVIEADIKLETILQLTNQIKTKETDEFLTINQEGTIITSLNKELALSRKNIVEEKSGLSLDLFDRNYSEGTILYPRENPNRAASYSFLKTIDWIVAYDQFLPEVLAVPLSIRSQFILLLSLTVIFIILVSFSLSGAITAPLKKLTKEVIKIGVQDSADANIVLKTGDEIEKLAESFNQMTERLNIKKIQVEQKTAELKNEKEKLEISYEEIVRRKNELEKFYDLTVGRELKMVELKKEIKKMENKFKKLS